MAGLRPAMEVWDLVLNEIPQPLVRALDMPAHGALGGPVIARPNSGDDGVMLIHRLLRDLAPETGAEDMDMDMQPRQRIRDQMVARPLRDQTVEIGVQVGKGIV